MNEILQRSKVHIAGTQLLKNKNNYNDVNRVYGSYLDSQPPAREAFQVSVLPKNVNIEISAIACL